MDEVESRDNERFMEVLDPLDIIEPVESARGSSGVDIRMLPDLREEGRRGLSRGITALGMTVLAEVSNVIWRGDCLTIPSARGMNPARSICLIGLKSPIPADGKHVVGRGDNSISLELSPSSPTACCESIVDKRRLRDETQD
jgi:hypothetical protein